MNIMIQAIRGTKDLNPSDAYIWQYLEEKFRSISNLFGYKELRTPIFEKTEVFSRSIGEETDIVNKEMYTFTDRGGESITLRPEMTAALVRSVIQNNLTHNNPVSRLWYFGPFFRYERPQKGRLRQFHQYGAECISSPHPESDFEIINLAESIIKGLNIKDHKMLINSLGNKASRDDYRNNLVDYLRSHQEKLSEDSRKRLETNPLRVLDSKAPQDKEISAQAPIILDYLDNESSDHFEKVKELLLANNIDFEINSRLVRGLDYYSHTVFEFQHNSLGSQDSFGGGGRYNELFEQLGGKPNPSVGFAMGVERILLVLEANKLIPQPKPDVDVYIVCQDIEDQAMAFKAAGIIRSKELTASLDLQRRSMKAQFREANKQGARFVIIIGKEEASKGVVSLKTMETGEQNEITMSKLAEFSFS